MPTSHYSQIGKIVEIMFLLRARSVLDIGIGYGKYGVLAREFLETWLEDKPYEQRKIKIDGIEAFPEYITEGQKYYYDEIFIGNALDKIDSTGSYDLILIIDVLEHFNREEGIMLLKRCAAKGKHVLIATPRDIGTQGAVFGNEFERHRYQWHPRDLGEFFPVTFFSNYHSIICLIGPEGKKVKKTIFLRKLKFGIRFRFPGLYRLYEKMVSGVSGNFEK